jgi:hypothetical protein
MLKNARNHVTSLSNLDQTPRARGPSVRPLSAMRVISPDPVPAALGGHAALFKPDKQKRMATVAYQLISGFIGPASWTLVAIGAFLFALAIFAAFMSS